MVISRSRASNALFHSRDHPLSSPEVRSAASSVEDSPAARNQRLSPRREVSAGPADAPRRSTVRHFLLSPKDRNPVRATGALLTWVFINWVPEVVFDHLLDEELGLAVRVGAAAHGVLLVDGKVLRVSVHRGGAAEDQIVHPTCLRFLGNVDQS
ncbi:hypothetical protein EYF80_006720 [Liparis tanakae]|uniref:Uncharacterized protein n=1 Tax=Liparis tanakae TaxID=230148 RepID=A0A4Z2J0Y3_9TELE|nr:hypothetical protein EYF80_006720 [Liparis tanakae]